METATSLSATRFTATVDAQPAQINPMDAPFQRNAAMNSVSALRGAVIAGDDGSTRPFVPAGTSDDDLAAVVQANQGLGKAYAGLGAAMPPRVAPRYRAPTAFATANFGDGILADAGDIFSWLESGVEAVVSIVEDAAEGVWHFVASIAGQIYHGILDCVEKVVGAIEWVYNTIKVLIEDIIAFLMFLLEWRDILTTHRVFKNVFRQFVQQAVDGLGDVRADLAGLIDRIEGEIDSWADIPDFGQTPTGTAGANPPPAGQYSAPAHLGIHHFQNSFTSASGSYAPPEPGEGIYQTLIDAVAAEQATIIAAMDAVKGDIIDDFSSLSVSDIIKRFAAILADTLLESAKNVLTAFIDLLVQLTDGMMDLFDATIDIPVLSWLSRELVGDDLSFLDLICLVAAIPATLIYKATAGGAPFPRDDAFTQGLIAASSFAEVRAQFVASDMGRAADAVLDQGRLKLFAVTTGFAALAGSFVLIYTSLVQKALDLVGADNAYPKMLATIACVGNVAYVSPNISGLINYSGAEWPSKLNSYLTYASVAKGIVAIPCAASQAPLVKDAFPAVETLINTVWNVPVICNLIANKDDLDSSYKSLIPETIGNFGFNLGGMLEYPIALMKDPENKLAAAAGQAALMLVYGLMITVAGGIYAWAPGQEH